MNIPKNMNLFDKSLSIPFIYQTLFIKLNHDPYRLLEKHQGYFAPGNSKVSNQSAKLLDSILNTKIEH